MMKLLILADDFTGALDTGVKFLEAGVPTKVTMDTEIAFDDVEEEVLVICTTTRHLPGAEAYGLIRRITQRAAAAGARKVFKKTDSALRGNVGAELSAVLDGSGEKSLCFIPALPAMNRSTVNGVHYIEGVPVAQSVFGKDPFDPVTESDIPTLLGQQCDTAVEVVPCGEQLPEEGEKACIYVLDCASDEDMEQQVQMLERCGRLNVLAGCAGFAASLPHRLGLRKEPAKAALCRRERLTVLCGSVNPISCSQMDYAEKNGYQRIHIPAETLLSEVPLQEGDGRQMLDQLWERCLQTDGLIIDSLQAGGKQVLEASPEMALEDIRKKISRRLGEILKALLDRGADARIMIIGGDTLLAFLEAIQCRELKLLGELQPGIVLSEIMYQGRSYEIVSKSGGFGGPALLAELITKKEKPVPG